jgi:hypothetical protein
MHLSGAIELGLAGAVLGLVAVVLLARRAAAAARDLGAMSGSWIAEQRSSEHTGTEYGGR